MTRKSKQSTEAAVRQIRRRTRRKFAPEEKIRIVLEGLRGEQSISELGRREGIAASLYYLGSFEVDLETFTDAVRSVDHLYDLLELAPAGMVEELTVSSDEKLAHDYIEKADQIAAAFGVPDLLWE